MARLEDDDDEGALEDLERAALHFDDDQALAVVLADRSRARERTGNLAGALADAKEVERVAPGKSGRRVPALERALREAPSRPAGE